MVPKAIGFIRRDVSGSHQAWDETQIRSLAARSGYNLCKVVAFGPATDSPIQRLRTAVLRTGAVAVFVPSLSHFGGDVVPIEIREVADVTAADTEERSTRRRFGGNPR
ncbi:hypothetical protein ACFXPS_41845 [Nocardia sp. NPDC059091]|uniref:hypothetical protein n=1 Tax=unclassified Nocardia TaxID=2637762 RepID=UPI0036763A81